jgi:hypothetical protein
MSPMSKSGVRDVLNEYNEMQKDIDHKFKVGEEKLKEGEL